MKRRLYASIDTELLEKLEATAVQRRVKKSQVVADALKAELKVSSLREDLQKAENRYLGASDLLAKTKAELREVREELKQVASKLGVPDTAAHCRQRIDEIETDCQVANDNVAMLTEERDLFKGKSEEATANLQHAEAKLKAYERQGFWARLFRRKPVVLPFAKPERLWQTPDKPVTPTSSDTETEATVE